MTSRRCDTVLWFSSSSSAPPGWLKCAKWSRVKTGSNSQGFVCRGGYGTGWVCWTHQVPSAAAAACARHIVAFLSFWDTAKYRKSSVDSYQVEFALAQRGYGAALTQSTTVREWVLNCNVIGLFGNVCSLREWSVFYAEFTRQKGGYGGCEDTEHWTLKVSSSPSP